MDVDYWYLFPIAVVVAAVANGAGIGGATFFSPLFVLVLKLQPQVAIGTALITEVFGFGSGVAAHARARTIDWQLAKMLAMVAVPAGIAGSLLGGLFPDRALKVVLGVGLIAIATVFIRHHDPDAEDAAIEAGEGIVKPFMERSMTTRDGQEFAYTICRRDEGQVFAGIGGLFVGLISTGLGEADAYVLVKRCRVPTRVAVATGVVVVAATALAASITHLIDFVRTGEDALDSIRNIVVFTIPGVLIGGQLGPHVVRSIPERTLIRGLGWLFLLVAAVTITEAIAA